MPNQSFSDGFLKPQIDVSRRKIASTRDLSETVASGVSIQKGDLINQHPYHTVGGVIPAYPMIKFGSTQGGITTDVINDQARVMAISLGGYVIEAYPKSGAGTYVFSTSVPAYDTGSMSISKSAELLIGSGDVRPFGMVPMSEDKFVLFVRNESTSVVDARTIQINLANGALSVLATSASIFTLPYNTIFSKMYSNKISVVTLNVSSQLQGIVVTWNPTTGAMSASSATTIDTNSDSKQFIGNHEVSEGRICAVMYTTNGTTHWIKARIISLSASDTFSLGVEIEVESKATNYGQLYTSAINSFFGEDRILILWTNVAVYQAQLVITGDSLELKIKGTVFFSNDINTLIARPKMVPIDRYGCPHFVIMNNFIHAITITKDYSAIGTYIQTLSGLTVYVTIGVFMYNTQHGCMITGSTNQQAYMYPFRIAEMSIGVAKESKSGGQKIAYSQFTQKR